MSKIEGFAPVVEVIKGHDYWEILRAWGATAVTIPEPIRGFQGLRKRWWDRKDEVPFPDWRTP